MTRHGRTARTSTSAGDPALLGPGWAQGLAGFVLDLTDVTAYTQARRASGRPVRVAFNPIPPA